MLIKRFDFEKLTRENINGKRYYITPAGEKLASVTTILSHTKTAETKKALNNWKNRIGHRKAQDITTEAAGRGTRMHSFLESYILNDKLEEAGSNIYSQQSRSMAQIIIENGLKHVDEFYGSEVYLYNNPYYGGTTDSVATYKGKLTILDFKQSNKPKKKEWIEDYFCQLCAYIECINVKFKENIKNGVVMMCSADYQYQQFEVDESNFSYYSDMWWSKVEQYYQMLVEEEN